ncbi:MAG: MltA domain-containing protein [Desulfobacterales bacterium]
MKPSPTPFRVALLVAAGAFLFLVGCPPAPPPAPPPATPAVPATAPLAPAPCPRFGDDLAFAGLEEALARGIAWMKRQPPGRLFDFGSERYPASHLVGSLERFRDLIASSPSADAFQANLEKEFRCYRASGRDGAGEVLFTGYYEPILAGRRAPDAEFRHPLWGRPDDLITVDLGEFHEKYRGERIAGRLEGTRLVPYPERREIEEQGLLFDRARPLAWVRDPLELFFLHVQGSGRIELEDGETLRVGYEASNGRPYRSIGRLLIEEGKVPREEISLAAIKRYLRAHPEEIGRVLSFNPSYVFFRLVPEGPIGSLGVPLTAGRSLALDRRLFPEGAIAFAVSRKPAPGDPSPLPPFWREMRRFLLVQDTGSAITGPGRADIFWGGGPEAETAAGHLNHPGELYFLLLKP